MQTITVDIGGSKALFEMHLGDRVEQYKIPTGVGFGIESLNQQLSELEADYGLVDYKLAIAVPGLVKNSQLISSKSLPCLNGFSREDLHSQAKTILLSNDIDAGMQAVLDPKLDCELLIMCGTGIGMAISINGKMFSGTTGFAGELGHCRVMTESGEFSLEQLASGDSIRIRELKSSKDLHRAGRYLGMGLAWSVNLFNPDRIWLAGGMMNNADYYKGCISSLNDMALTAPLSEAKVARVDDMETLVCRGLKVLLDKQV
ncbi:ROK family protein [Shewanella eurypsychrophilus]|uniref:ROK family protein n=1 Tax=Shewanella eurypsychrophilus TaxID=2593656 RepID=A0ABX6V5T4_9GAMM|nr:MULTISPECIES: ROK family protein [Shewanella]QFU21606.1 ROK family protein [Shewanella sp. YLB-09]QPG56896.1 ROK family protein [Shewanella eurypsychrophilus]